MLGTHFLLQSLREMGRNDLAFTIANQQDYPGWGYLLAQGATTFGEHPMSAMKGRATASAAAGTDHWVESAG